MARYCIIGPFRDSNKNLDGALSMIPIEKFGIVKMSDDEFEQQFGDTERTCSDEKPAQVFEVSFEGTGVEVDSKQLIAEFDKMDWDKLSI